MAALQKVFIEITSDTICPWCFIGYRHIQDAIKQAKDANLPLDFSIKFSPFELSPGLPPSPGYDKNEYVASKFGAARAKVALGHVAEAARQAGIILTHEGRLSSTIDSHRLIEKARLVGGEQGQLKVVEALFRAYHERSEDIGDSNMLATQAAASGLMTKSEALDFIASDELKSEIQAGLARARASRISGVPYTVIDSKYSFSGAQPASAFLNAFKEVAKAKAASPVPQPSAEGLTC